MWIIISIVLAINSMWLLKPNKDLIRTNDELIAKNIMMSLMITHEQREMVDSWVDDSEEDK